MPNGNPVGRSFAGAETDASSGSEGRASHSPTDWLAREAPRKSGVWETRASFTLCFWKECLAETAQKQIRLFIL